MERLVGASEGYSSLLSEHLNFVRLPQVCGSAQGNAQTFAMTLCYGPMPLAGCRRGAKQKPRIAGLLGALYCLMKINNGTFLACMVQT
jgi:hypothetical protein